MVVVLILLLIHNRLIFPRPSQDSQLQFVTVARQDIKVTISTSGIFTGKDTASLHFKTGGKLAYVNIKTGDQVFAGETLAGLDTQDLAIQLQQANNTLRDKQAMVDKFLDDIHLFQYGNGGFDNIGSINETSAQRALRTTAEVTRDNAFDSIRASQLAFWDTTLTSPISGIVTKANIFPGQIIGATDIINIVDFSQPTFEADVEESDITKISAGQKAEVTLNAYGDKVFPGEINDIGLQTKNTSSGATVITVKVSLKDQTIQNIAGLNGQVNIITEEKTGVLTIPQEALREDGTVLIEAPQGVRPVKVTPGLKNDTNVEIVEGLKDGDRVMLNPPAGIQFRGQQNPFTRILRGFRTGRS